ncbi:hypothetical protein LSTR_LSTR015130 [Laodelphax striatellus]|uniref:Uncharacterized protein n=1 Tax=Laodelphax striatellus TaxID=195883 RepID=A0A482X703_LAOST|nr:hypothetical protein LSTR_LSTR015130 [Laodelphax striatellus]
MSADCKVEDNIDPTLGQKLHADHQFDTTQTYLNWRQDQKVAHQQQFQQQQQQFYQFYQQNYQGNQEYLSRPSQSYPNLIDPMSRGMNPRSFQTVSMDEQYHDQQLLRNPNVYEDSTSPSAFLFGNEGYDTHASFTNMNHYQHLSQSTPSLDVAAGSWKPQIPFSSDPQRRASVPGRNDPEFYEQIQPQQHDLQDQQHLHAQGVPVKSDYVKMELPNFEEVHQMQENSLWTTGSTDFVNYGQVLVDDNSENTTSLTEL